MLDHHPENYPIYTKTKDIDLILSGHTHGGQMTILGKGLFAPGQVFSPKYCAGVYDDKLVVSRGMSNPWTIPRICNPEELVYIHIKGTSSS